MCWPFVRPWLLVFSAFSPITALTPVNYELKGWKNDKLWMEAKDRGTPFPNLAPFAEFLRLLLHCGDPRQSLSSPSGLRLFLGTLKPARFSHFPTFSTPNLFLF